MPICHELSLHADVCNFWTKVPAGKLSFLTFPSCFNGFTSCITGPTQVASGSEKRGHKKFSVVQFVWPGVKSGVTCCEFVFHEKEHSE